MNAIVSGVVDEQVKSAGARRVLDVPPRSMQLIICASRCRFSIRGFRAKAVTASGEDTVTIDNKRLNLWVTQLAL